MDEYEFVLSLIHFVHGIEYVKFTITIHHALKSDKWHLNAAHPHKYSNNSKLNKKHFSRPMKITSLAFCVLINENAIRSMLAIIFAYHNARFNSFSHFAASNCKFFTIAILIFS